MGNGRTTPHIIGFGAQKAGTSWLFENLSMNPVVWKPILKEMHYFTHATMGMNWMLREHRDKLIKTKDNLKAKGSNDKLNHVERLLKIKMLSEEWYREAYAPCPDGKVSMDITPAYAMLGDEGVEYMKRYVGDDLKSIFIVRDPADRAISSIKNSLSRTEGDSKSPDFWVKQLKSNTVWARSLYGETISRLDRLIGDKNIFMPFGMIKSDPTSFLRMIESHCGLPEGDYRSASRARHVSPEVQVPDTVRDIFAQELRAQYDFLDKRFEPLFLSRI